MAGGTPEKRQAGAQARAKKLSRKQRGEIAVKAAKARWKKPGARSAQAKKAKAQHLSRKAGGQT